MELADLKQLDRQGLIEYWQATFGVPAPKQCGQELMRQALGWKIQAKAQGGLSAATRKQLKRGDATELSHGTQLLRVWKGETHQVSVVPEGYLYRGRHWKSLSAIAREITGTPWSGPVFFGLKK